MSDRKDKIDKELADREIKEKAARDKALKDAMAAEESLEVDEKTELETPDEHSSASVARTDKTETAELEDELEENIEPPSVHTSGRIAPSITPSLQPPSYADTLSDETRAAPLSFSGGHLRNSETEKSKKTSAELQNLNNNEALWHWICNKKTPPTFLDQLQQNQDNSLLRLSDPTTSGTPGTPARIKQKISVRSGLWSDRVEIKFVDGKISLDASHENPWYQTNSAVVLIGCARVIALKELEMTVETELKKKFGKRLEEMPAEEITKEREAIKKSLSEATTANIFSFKITACNSIQDLIKMLREMSEKDPKLHATLGPEVLRMAEYAIKHPKHYSEEEINLFEQQINQQKEMAKPKKMAEEMPKLPEIPKNVETPKAPSETSNTPERPKPSEEQHEPPTRPRLK